MLRAVLVAFIATAAAAVAQDPDLAALRTTLATVRSKMDQATLQTLPPPELTTSKHQLRDWIEKQIIDVKDPESAGRIAKRINEALDAARLPIDENEENRFGTISNVDIAFNHGLLVITTGVGIVCQLDQSAYGYKEIDGRWQRVWQSEQNDYSGGKYKRSTFPRSRYFSSGRQVVPWGRRLL